MYYEEYSLSPSIREPLVLTRTKLSFQPAFSQYSWKFQTLIIGMHANIHTMWICLEYVDMPIFLVVDLHHHGWWSGIVSSRRITSKQYVYDLTSFFIIFEMVIRFILLHEVKVEVGAFDIALHLPSCNDISPTKSPKKHLMKFNLLRRFRLKWNF